MHILETVKRTKYSRSNTYFKFIRSVCVLLLIENVSVCYG
jgi:hypothetical protein